MNSKLIRKKIQIQGGENIEKLLGTMIWVSNGGHRIINMGVSKGWTEKISDDTGIFSYFFISQKGNVMASWTK